MNNCDVYCPKCGECMESSVVHVELRDGPKLDICISCPECDHALNGFLSMADLVEMQQ